MSSSAQTIRRRRVNIATLIGTTVEWYDFFIYATAAGLVFAQLFFEPAGAEIGLLLSFVSVGISFLFRPLGAFLAGHFGDLLGRRKMLMLTLVLMGGSTVLIGLLPTYAAIGVAAPILLLLLRVLQGVSAGGEWGGAVLMAVEHAPSTGRGRAGAYPQLGVPLGMLLATGVTAIMVGFVSPGEAFTAWGWRVPFLLSFVLIFVGYFIRRAVEESPVFEEIAARKQQSRMPIVTLFRKHWLLVLLSALLFAGNSACGYIATAGFIPAYATNPDGPVGLDATTALLGVCSGAAGFLVFTYIGGLLADRIGRKPTYLIGYALLAVMAYPLFWMINTAQTPLFFLSLLLFSVGLGLSYGPQAAWFAELFPASVRFSGISISYAIGAILGGAFAPTIASGLLQATGTTAAVSLYLLAAVVISIVAAVILRDRPGIDLSIDNERNVSGTGTVFDRPSELEPTPV